MNILFICDEYPPGLNGGIGSITQSLAREMVKQGHKVCVAGLYTYGYGAADYEEDEGVKVWRLRYGFRLPNLPILYTLQRKIPSRLKSILYGAKNFREFEKFIQRLVKDHAIDIIEQPDWNTFSYDIGIKHPLFLALPIPLLVKSHGTHTYFSKELNSIPEKRWHEIDQQLYARADALAAVSHYTASINQELFHPKKEIKVLYNAIHTHSNGCDQTDRANELVFFSGTLVYKKGIFSLLEAWNEVINLYPTAQLVVFGKGDIKSAQKKLSVKAQKSVQFMGHQAREILVKYLQTATIAVFPSYSETFGLVAVEAMNEACPTVFTKLSCGPEIITDGENGCLVNPKKTQEITETIIHLLKHPELRQRLGKKGQESVHERFDLFQSVKDHIKYYTEVIAKFNQNSLQNL